jgi:hypothetical protein
MGTGKWIAGILGWAMFGPIGGILGYYFASRVEKLAESAVVYSEDQTYNQGQRNSFLMKCINRQKKVIYTAVCKTFGNGFHCAEIFAEISVGDQLTVGDIHFFCYLMNGADSVGIQ